MLVEHTKIIEAANADLDAGKSFYYDVPEWKKQLSSDARMMIGQVIAQAEKIGKSQSQPSPATKEPVNFEETVLRIHAAAASEMRHDVPKQKKETNFGAMEPGKQAHILRRMFEEGDLALHEVRKIMDTMAEQRKKISSAAPELRQKADGNQAQVTEPSEKVAA